MAGVQEKPWKITQAMKDIERLKYFLIKTKGARGCNFATDIIINMRCSEYQKGFTESDDK